MKMRSVELQNRTKWDIINHRHLVPHFGTFTFKEEVDPHARHWQRWIKRVRKAGIQVRYVAVHDWGRLRGRYHLHGILLLSGKPPPWPHGYSSVLRLTGTKAVGYCCGYNAKKLDMMAEWSLRVLTSQRFGRYTEAGIMKKILSYALRQGEVPRYFADKRSPPHILTTVPYSVRRAVSDASGLPLEAACNV